MTDEQKQSMTWLEWQSKVTGKPVEEIREEMRRRGSLANRSKMGFAHIKKTDPERLKKISSRGGKSGKSKEAQNSRGKE